MERRAPRKACPWLLTGLGSGIGLLLLGCPADPPEIGPATSSSTSVDSGGPSGAETGAGPGDASIAGTADSEATDSDSATGSPAVAPPSGRYLVAIALKLNPSEPLQWEVLIDRDAGTAAGTSLSLDEGSTTEPRDPVGEPWVGEFTVARPPSFSLVTPELIVPASANTVVDSDAATTELHLAGSATQGYWCGEIAEGSVTSPVMVELAGSAFAMVPIASGADFPLEFPTGC